MKVSIIVPVYKVEGYLERCLRTIDSQTFRDFELILIDDGSPDNCGRICDDFAKEHTYVKVIHQINQGQAAARNHAMEISEGDFIVFVDSDDFIEEDCLEYLIDLQERYDADVTIGSFRYYYEGTEIPERAKAGKEVVMTAEETLIAMNYSRGFGATPWAKLYKKQLILDHPFPEGQIYEDLATLYKIIGDCKKIVYGDYRIYYWVQREGSTMRMPFDKRQMAGIEAASAQLSYIKSHFPKAVPAAKARYMGKTMEIMALALHSKNARESYRQLKSKMLYFKDVMVDGNVKRTLKMRMICAKAGYLPAKIGFSLHEKAKKKKFR